MVKSGSHISLRKLEAQDWDSVSKIYALGIATGIATFETAVPTWDLWNEAHLKSCRFVACAEEKLLGWAALSPVSDRCVYGGVAEVSVYVDPKYAGMGVGSQLLTKLIFESEKQGFWTLQSGIFPQNKASLNLHKKLGFREIGYREKVGMKEGVWHDNILLEKRSTRIGID